MKMFYVVSDAGAVMGAFYSRALADELCAEYNRVHRFFDFHFHVEEKDEDVPFITFRC